MESKIVSTPSLISTFVEYEQTFSTTFSNNFSPIFDHLSQIYIPFRYLDFIQVLICIMHIIETSFWMENGNYWHDSRTEQIIHYISFFSTDDMKMREIYIYFGIYASVVFIISASFIVSIIHYSKTRRMIRSLLYIIRIYFMLFGTMIIHLWASLISHLFIEIIDNKKIECISILTFSIIFFIISIFLFYLNQTFTNQSIYIQKSLWSTFDSTGIIFMFIADPLFLILSHLFNYYPTWSFYVLLIIHIISIILTYTVFQSIYFPFVINFTNCLECSLFVSLVFNDVFRMVAEFYPKIAHSTFAIVCYLCFFVFTLASFFIFKFIKRKIDRDLSYYKLNSYLANPDEKTDLKLLEISSEDKYEYFDQLGLDRNIIKAMTYLIVGFTSSSELFIDFSLAKYCMDKHQDSEKMIVLLIHLLSYFRSEKKLFDVLLKQFHTFRNTSSYSQFIYYQASKIKAFRQETTTNVSTMRLNELKLLSNDLKNQIKAFWSLETANMYSLEILEQQKRRLINLWDESIEDNWTSISFRESHIQFLIESCTDYEKAVEMTSIKDKIDILRNERDDLCFLSLISCFPRYLSHKIVNKNGDIVIKKGPKEHSSSSTNNQSEHLSTSSYDNDFSIEEQIANSIITYGRLRLSIQNALNYIKPTFGKVLSIYTLVAFFGSLLLIIIPFSLFLNSFNSINDWNSEVGVLNELRIAYGKAFLSLSILFGQKTNKFNPDLINCDNSYGINHYFFDNSVPFNELALMYIDRAREYYGSLMTAILNLGLQRVDITTLTDLFFEQTVTSNFCYFGEIIDQINWSMEQTLNFQILSFGVLANDNEVANWYNNTYWCHDITTFPNVESKFNSIHNALTYDLSNSSYSKSKATRLEMVIIAPSYLLIFFVPFPIILFFYSKEINHLIYIMLLTDQEYKEQARKNISLTVANENNDNISPPITKVTMNWKFPLYLIIIFICFFGFLIFVELILYYNMKMNDKFRNFGFWTCYFSLLKSYNTEIMSEIINAVYFVDIDANYITNRIFRERIRNITINMKKILYEILNDTPDSPASVGSYSLIDDVVLKSACLNTSSSNSIHLHDIYRCASLGQVMSTVYTLSTKISEEIEKYNGIFQGEELSNIFHIIFGHAIESITEIVDFINIVQDNEISNFRTNITLFLICGIIVLLIWLCFIYLLIFNYKNIFEMAICLIRRLSPVGLINNNDLTNYLLYKKGEEIEMGVTHTIFNNSFDGIICMNIDGIIEIINKSFANDYGYSTEQLVGQLIGTIFDEESKSKLESQIKMIKSHESSGYNDDVICFTNDGRKVPSHITLFAIKGKESNLILVVSDETILQQKKRRLELAKKRSQDLLEQIMPPKVLMMLKEGHSEISFTVDSASVMFIDIVNFSRFSADLSPQQIMGTLSALFGSFDTWIQKYPLMTKIKLIGDIYMAACGLFVEKDPKEHAEQCIEFALLVLNILEDTNIKLNINLQIRIGVNSDGPIIAGVLGKENRVFDIIGDPINVASRLEHKAEPGHILMSEKTYDLVKDVGYVIFPKGKMLLKGKGNMEAYSI